MRCEGEKEGGASEGYKETFMNCKQTMDLLCSTTRNERFLRDYQCVYVVLYIHVHICDPSTLSRAHTYFGCRTSFTPVRDNHGKQHHSLHWVRTTGTFPVESRRHMSSMGNVTLVLLASNVRSTNAHANPSAVEALEASDALISVALVSVGVASSGGSHPAD